MKKNKKVMMALAILAGACTFQEEPEVIVRTPARPISPEQINAEVLNILQEKQEFKWEWVSTDFLSSALLQTDTILTIGYQPDGFDDLKGRIHEVNLGDPEWKSARESVLAEIQEVYDRLGIATQIRDRVTLTHGILPYFKVKLYEVEVLDRLRSLSTVRYAEPQTFTYEDPQPTLPSKRTYSSSGCDVNPASSIAPDDFTSLIPGSKVPWNYHLHHIPTAWTTSTGDNVTVGLIDTGISPSQGKLNGEFSSGYSTGRSITRYGTYVSSFWWWADPDGPDDQCGHGTQMAGTISAPRTASGTTLGVAYKADLAAVRGTGDVVINGGREKDGVCDGLVLLGNRSDVKIISMSIGDVLSSGQVSDAILYAYNRGKMIICAAGTSLSWTSWWGVIFPASMSETIAVTGIKDNGYNRCNTCHDGDKVDFTIVMQRASDTDRTSLTLAPSGNQPANVGGSSVATATTAGIAALVWATNPGQTREQVLQRLKNASDFYPSRNSNFGWGTIDASLAVQ